MESDARWKGSLTQVIRLKGAVTRDCDRMKTLGICTALGIWKSSPPPSWGGLRAAKIVAPLLSGNLAHCLSSLCCGFYCPSVMRLHRFRCWSFFRADRASVLFVLIFPAAGTCNRYTLQTSEELTSSNIFKIT